MMVRTTPLYLTRDAAEGTGPNCIYSSGTPVTTEEKQKARALVREHSLRARVGKVPRRIAAPRGPHERQRAFLEFLQPYKNRLRTG
jgi:hypothetical protein